MPTDPFGRGGPLSAKAPRKPQQFRVTPAMLPPGALARKQTIDSLVTKSFTAPPKQAKSLASALTSMHLSPEETSYVQRSSATRGDQAIKAKSRADLRDVTHSASSAAHSLLNLAGLNPKAILHNAAVVGSSSLPVQAGVKPHGTISNAGIPIIGPGAVGHGAALGILPFKRLLGRAAEEAAVKEAPHVAPEIAKAIHPNLTSLRKDARYWDYSTGKPQISQWGLEQRKALEAKVTPSSVIPAIDKNVPRSSEEAAQHVAQAAKAAKDRGFGAKPPEPQKVEPGTVTPTTGGDLGATVRQALKGTPAVKGVPGAAVRGAASLRAEQEAARSVERGVRAGKAAEAMKKGGLEGHYAALGTLKGELPKVQFKGFQNLDSDTITEMINHAQTHPELRPYEKINTVNAILKAADGKVPTNSEHVLLERAFGKEVADSTVKASTWRDNVGRSLAEVVNLPRALQSSFDLSAPFRQGLVAGVSHPAIFSRNLLPMVKAFGSERVYNGIMEGVHTDPLFPLADKAKLAITDVHSHALGGREEAYMSRLIGKIPLLRGSGRAYTGFLVKTRFDIFKHLAQQAAEQGRDLNNPKVLKDVATFVNAATGRGTMGKLEPAAVVLNSTLFSPRLLASRLNFLNPVWYAKLDPFARKEALKAAAGLVLTMGTVLEMSKFAGATVNMDPTNADFGKMKFGNTRVDIAAGFQQPIRLLFEEASGHITSSTTGKTLTLGPSGPGKLSRWDILERFGISKLGPTASVASDLLHGQDFIGNPVTLKGEASSHLTPMLWQDLYDLYNNGGVPSIAKGVVPGMFGVGLQTYGSQPTPSTDPFSRGGTAPKKTSDPFGRSGTPASGKSSDPFGR